MPVQKLLVHSIIGYQIPSTSFCDTASIWWCISWPGFAISWLIRSNTGFLHRSYLFAFWRIVDFPINIVLLHLTCHANISLLYCVDISVCLGQRTCISTSMWVMRIYFIGRSLSHLRLLKFDLLLYFLDLCYLFTLAAFTSIWILTLIS